MSTELQEVHGESTQLAEFRDLVSRAIDSGLGVDSMERLLDMYRQQKADWARERYYQALSEFQSQCPEIPKQKKVHDKYGQYRYSYAPLDTIVATVKEQLRDHGFSYSIETEQSAEWVTAICRTYHADGHSESTRFSVPIDPKAYMNAQQKVASALTYAKRYAFCDAFGILTTDEDDDANTAGQNDENVKPASPPPEQPPTNGSVPKEKPRSDGRRDPKRQEWVDKIVEVLQDEVFTDADRKRFKGALPELKTYDDLKSHLEATREERVRRWNKRDQEAKAEQSFEEQEPERAQAESKVPEPDVDKQIEEATNDDGELF